MFIIIEYDFNIYGNINPPSSPRVNSNVLFETIKNHESGSGSGKGD